jgi:hypothetical protein
LGYLPGGSQEAHNLYYLNSPDLKVGAIDLAEMLDFSPIKKSTTS